MPVKRRATSNLPPTWRKGFLARGPNGDLNGSWQSPVGGWQNAPALRAAQYAELTKIASAQAERHAAHHHHHRLRAVGEDLVRHPGHVDEPPIGDVGGQETEPDLGGHP